MSMGVEGNGRVVRWGADSFKSFTIKKLDAEHTAEALKFLVHFTVKITQPLPDEALEVGGNDITLLWNGASSNLDHVWGTEMITKLAGSDTVANLNASIWTEFNHPLSS